MPWDTRLRSASVSPVKVRRVRPMVTVVCAGSKRSMCICSRGMAARMPWDVVASMVYRPTRQAATAASVTWRSMALQVMDSSSAQPEVASRAAA